MFFSSHHFKHLPWIDKISKTIGPEMRIAFGLHTKQKSSQKLPYTFACIMALSYGKPDIIVFRISQICWQNASFSEVFSFNLRSLSWNDSAFHFFASYASFVFRINLFKIRRCEILKRTNNKNNNSHKWWQWNGWRFEISSVYCLNWCSFKTLNPKHST